jgi:PHP family Zn ribbon phosphoesterase
MKLQPHLLKGTELEINVDLHSHSGYAGGVGDIALGDIAVSMKKKGIHIFGTGDCLHPGWNAKLHESLEERETGLFALHEANENPDARFLLQTEIIITAATAVTPGRKNVHCVFLFPSFKACSDAVELLESWGVKNTIGRPFLKCEGPDDVAAKLAKILELDPGIEMIPAHVMTPQGVFGSANPVNRLSDFFGEAVERINAVETGLSADPAVLDLIPELDELALVSCSDCHSAASNRLGREFTAFEVKEFSYPALLGAIRSRRVAPAGEMKDTAGLRKRHENEQTKPYLVNPDSGVAWTAEFNPGEGKYFLSGHRAGKQGHDDGYCVYSPDKTPEDGRCPVCGKAITIGVLERAFQISQAQGANRELQPESKRRFVHMVPLSEVVAYSLGIANPNSKKVTELYEKVVAAFGTEIELWKVEPHTVRELLEGIVPQDVTDTIVEIKNDNFTFEPLGFDGSYGKLVVGRTSPWFGVSTVKMPSKHPGELF